MTKQKPKVNHETQGQKHQRLAINIWKLKKYVKVYKKLLLQVTNELMPIVKIKKHLKVDLDGVIGSVEYIHRDKMILDSKRLKEEKPKLYEQYLKPSESNEIKVTLVPNIDTETELQRRERIAEDNISIQRVDAQTKKDK